MKTTNSDPNKNLLRSITTFNELDDYISVLTSVLDYVDNYEGHPFFVDYSPNSTFKITKNTHGVDGYDLKLLKLGQPIACVGYYNLDESDTTWVKCYSTGHTHIYAFRSEDGKGTFDFQCDDFTYTTIPFNVEDYNETMYHQLEFVYQQEQVNVAMCIAKLMSSDKERQFRQFVIYENKDTDYRCILQELKDFVYTKTMIQGGFE